MNDTCPAECKTYTRHAPDAWRVARKAYIQGKVGNLAQAARLSGIPVATIQNQAKKDSWNVARQRYNEAQAALIDCPPLVIEPVQNTPEPKADANAEVAKLNEQITAMNGLLDECLAKGDIRAIPNLTKAVDMLEERKRIKLGIPLPGSQRPSRKPSRAMPSRDLQPQEVAPSQVSSRDEPNG